MKGLAGNVFIVTRAFTHYLLFRMGLIERAEAFDSACAHQHIWTWWVVE